MAKRKLTAEDKADLAHWEAKRKSAFAAAKRGDITAGFALMGIIRQCEYIKQYGTPKAPPPVRMVKRG